MHVAWRKLSPCIVLAFSHRTGSVHACISSPLWTPLSQEDHSGQMQDIIRKTDQQRLEEVIAGAEKAAQARREAEAIVEELKISYENGRERLENEMSTKKVSASKRCVPIAAHP